MLQTLQGWLVPRRKLIATTARLGLRLVQNAVGSPVSIRSGIALIFAVANRCYLLIDLGLPKNMPAEFPIGCANPERTQSLYCVKLTPFPECDSCVQLIRERGASWGLRFATQSRCLPVSYGGPEALETRLLNDWPWKAIDWILPTVLKNPQATTMTPLSCCDDRSQVVGNGGGRHSLRR